MENQLEAVIQRPKPASRPIRALLVDDHALFRESVARRWRASPDLHVEHCASIRDALTLLAQQPFDLVLLDHDLGANAPRSSCRPRGRRVTRAASWW